MDKLTMPEAHLLNAWDMLGGIAAVVLCSPQVLHSADEVAVPLPRPGAPLVGTAVLLIQVDGDAGPGVLYRSM
jgi:hypothetical protein